MPVLQTQPGGPTRFTVQYQIVMPASTAPGNAYQYRKPSVIVDGGFQPPGRYFGCLERQCATDCGRTNRNSPDQGS